jgi:hypothetical protein
VGCRWHLYLDVDADGRVCINFPGVELDDMPATCALELIDAHPAGMPIEDIGAALGVTTPRALRLLETAQARAADALRYLMSE